VSLPKQEIVEEFGVKSQTIFFEAQGTLHCESGISLMPVVTGMVESIYCRRTGIAPLAGCPEIHLSGGGSKKDLLSCAGSRN
jgi:hypothetical protein